MTVMRELRFAHTPSTVTAITSVNHWSGRGVKES
jgi:hypothetical protein